MSWLSLLASPFKRVWGIVAMVLGGVVALWAYGRTQRSKGRTEAHAEQTEKIHEKAEKAEEVRRDARTNPDSRRRVRKFDRNR